MAVVFLVSQLLIVFLITLSILHKYGNFRKQHPLVTVSTLIAWYFAFMIIFLIPLDVVLTFYGQCLVDSSNVNATDTKSNFSIISNQNSSISSTLEITRSCRRPSSYIARQAFLSLWEFVYWTSQILTWLVLPVLQSYCKMGEFTTLGKFKSALVENLIYYATCCGVFLLFLIYVAIRGESLNPSNLKAICIAASNTWGLFWLVFLLGYGLVEIPRRVWSTSNNQYRLQKVYFDVEKLSTDKNDAEETFNEIFREVNSVFEHVKNEPVLRRLAEIIMQQFPDSMKSRRMNSSSIVSSYNDEKSLAKLHKKVKQAEQTQISCRAHWDYLIEKALHLEDVVRNQTNSDQLFIRTSKRRMGFLEALVCVPKIEWIWECVLKSPLLKILAMFCIFMSFVVVWSEVTFSSSDPVLSLAAIFVRLASQRSDYNYIEVSSIITLAYLCICAYYTVFRIRIYRYYHLDPRHNSDENSLIFSAMLFCRLTPPLCLNYLSLIHMDSHVTGKSMDIETAYTTLMGHMDVVSFIANGFNVYFPTGVLLVCLATYFRLATRLLHYIGVEQFIDDDELTSELVQGGRALVSAERNRLQRVNEREARDEFWRQKLTDHDPTRPLRNNKAGKPSFPGGTIQQTPDYRDVAYIIDNAEPPATSSGNVYSNLDHEDETPDYNEWFTGNSPNHVNLHRPNTGNSRTSEAEARNSNKGGIFDDL